MVNDSEVVLLSLDTCGPPVFGLVKVVRDAGHAGGEGGQGWIRLRNLTRARRLSGLKPKPPKPPPKWAVSCHQISSSPRLTTDARVSSSSSCLTSHSSACSDALDVGAALGEGHYGTAYMAFHGVTQVVVKVSCRFYL